MDRKKLTVILWSCLCMVCSCVLGQQARVPVDAALDLSGSWKVFLGAGKADTSGNVPDSVFREGIKLPGTLEENRKGKQVKDTSSAYLNQSWQYTGAAWYQKEIDIPESWRGKELQLYLERTKVSTVWLDGRKVGRSALLSAPQVHILGEKAVPGKHRLTICIDNSPQLVAVGGAHALSAHTQTNWNGIIGKIELKALSQLRIERLKIKPDAAGRTVVVELYIRNRTRQNVVVKIESFLPDRRHQVPPLQLKLRLHNGDTLFRVAYPMGAGAVLWSEYNPALYTMRVSLLRNKSLMDTVSAGFGLRDFRPSGTQFSVNGAVTFLRGKNDGCIFPLTGYPPTDVATWRKLYRTAKSYGINHYRFHSYTPPEAAFEAADLEGLYLQAELPNWANFSLKDTAHIRFQYREARAILDTYGNHPSFVMCSLGNELGGDEAVHSKMVEDLKAYDDRVLYTQGTNAFYNDPHPGKNDDFWVTMRTGKEDQKSTTDVRGAFATTEAIGNGILNSLPPSTRRNFSAVKDLSLPVIGHETGQYQSYPDYTEIPKYTGILRPLNLEIFKRRLEEKGMGNQAHDFFRASGMFSALLYREEVEMALRTPGFAGFQLLDLQDYPGQGTALVGLLNVFMENKGLISAETFRSFNNDVVLQLLMDKYTWTNNETYTANVQLVNYSLQNLDAEKIKWSVVRPADNEVLATGEFAPGQAAAGGIHPAGKIVLPLYKIKQACKLMVKLQIPGSGYRAEYPIWVYPSDIDLEVPVGVSIAGRIDAFPTEFHTNWQWWSLLKNSRPLILDSTESGYRPIVQVIDNIDRNHKLGLVFEFKTGKGRLLVSMINLPALLDKPEARQLYHSMLKYISSDQFKPSAQLSPGQLNKLL